MSIQFLFNKVSFQYETKYDTKYQCCTSNPPIFNTNYLIVPEINIQKRINYVTSKLFLVSVSKHNCYILVVCDVLSPQPGPRSPEKAIKWVHFLDPNNIKIIHHSLVQKRQHVLLSNLCKVTRYMCELFNFKIIIKSSELCLKVENF